MSLKIARDFPKALHFGGTLHGKKSPHLDSISADTLLKCPWRMPRIWEKLEKNCSPFIETTKNPLFRQSGPRQNRNGFLTPVTRPFFSAVYRGDITPIATFRLEAHLVDVSPTVENSEQIFRRYLRWPKVYNWMFIHMDLELTKWALKMGPLYLGPL